MSGGLRVRLAVAMVVSALGLVAGTDGLTFWRLEPGGLVSAGWAPDRPLAVGSLMKPFVAKAWALAHPFQPAPRFVCPPESVCWFKPGHGQLGLAEALTVSCNSYFLSLAEATPLATLGATLAGEGFQPSPRSAREAMGLGEPSELPGITPSALLAAYARLVREPWPPAAEAAVG